MSEGYIYCFSNSAFPKLLKIGMTQRTPEERLREANSCTWCPNPYEIVLAKKVTKPREKEKSIHLLLSKYGNRENKNREFFEIEIDEVKQFFNLIDGEYHTNDNDNKIKKIKGKSNRLECPFNCNVVRADVNKMVNHIVNRCQKRPKNSCSYKYCKNDKEYLNIENNIIKILIKLYKVEYIEWEGKILKEGDILPNC